MSRLLSFRRAKMRCYEQPKAKLFGRAKRFIARRCQRYIGILAMMAWATALCSPAVSQLNIVSGTVTAAQNCDPTAIGESIEVRLITSSLPVNDGVSDIGGLIYGSRASAFVTLAHQPTIILARGGWSASLTGAFYISMVSVNNSDYGLIFESRGDGMLPVDASLPFLVDQHPVEEMSLDLYDYREQDVCHLTASLLEAASFVPGDAKMDGAFDSSDLVDVMTTGQYDDAVSLNSAWETGDWDGDRDFTSGDLLWAAAYGEYAGAVRPAPRPVPEPVDSVRLFFLIFGCALAGRSIQN